jgi:hypothetical protein
MAARARSAVRRLSEDQAGLAPAAVRGPGRPRSRGRPRTRPGSLPRPSEDQAGLAPAAVRGPGRARSGRRPRTRPGSLRPPRVRQPGSLKVTRICTAIRELDDTPRGMPTGSGPKRAPDAERGRAQHHRPMEDAGETVDVTVTLVVGADPIRGPAAMRGGNGRDFWGWLELSEIFQRATERSLTLGASGSTTYLGTRPDSAATDRGHLRAPAFSDPRAGAGARAPAQPNKTTEGTMRRQLHTRATPAFALVTVSMAVVGGGVLRGHRRRDRADVRGQGPDADSGTALSRAPICSRARAPSRSPR